MNFISIDIETTGLDPEKCQIIEFGAVVVENWNIVGKYRRIIWNSEIKGEPFAISMNINIINEFSKFMSTNDFKEIPGIITEKELTIDFINWINENKFNFETTKKGTIKINVAGKNYSQFDSKFLNKIPNWTNLIEIHRRVLDPSILYFNSMLDKENLPSLEDCKLRSKLFKTDEIKVKHRADKDAEDVAILLIEKLKP